MIHWALVVLALGAVDAGAQAVARPASARDSLATRVVYDAILAELTGFLARGAIDSGPRPWTLTVPSETSDSSGIAWRALRDDLSRLLRARAPVATDSTRSHLIVQLARATADSLVVEFDIGHYERCRNRTDWQGSHTTRRLAIAWETLTWPFRAEPQEHGDMAPCEMRRT